MEGEHQTERIPVETRSYPTPDSPASGSGSEPTPLSADGLVLVSLAAAAALDPSVFSKVNVSEAVPGILGGPGAQGLGVLPARAAGEELFQLLAPLVMSKQIRCMLSENRILSQLKS